MPIILGIIAVIALVAGGVLFFSAEDTLDATTPEAEEAARIDSAEETQTTPETDDSTNVELEAETEVEASAAGIEVQTKSDSQVNVAQSYKASANYLTPSRETLEVTVSLTVAADGTITDSEVIYDDGAGYSNGNQERFDQAYASQVEGKLISEVELSRVGGASLTTEAFNEAVAKIEAQQA